MSLANIYQELHRRASETGQDRNYQLKGGAKIAVRVRDNVVTLTIARKAKRVGDTELLTFKRDCGVPAYAIRYPADDQATRNDDDGVLWFFICYRWIEGGDD